MPLAIRHRHDPAPDLAPLDGLVVRQEDDPAAMAALQGRDVASIAARMSAGHRAWVAVLHGAPAAWGWVATREAEIGELGATFAIPAGDRYLWNFVTRPEYRGLGIYPRLLDAIVRAESLDASAEVARFWIAYAPENRASGAGIRKAGFVPAGELSFDAAGRAAVHAPRRSIAASASRVFGLPIADEALAPCWRCVRAGRPMRCRAGECRCDYQRSESGCAA